MAPVRKAVPQSSSTGNSRGLSADASTSADTTPSVHLPPPRRSPNKKRPIPKGLLKLKPKLGCRMLGQQLKDYATITIVLFLTAIFGVHLREQKQLQQQVHEVEVEHTEHTGADAASHDAHDSLHVLNVQATLVICVFLIVTTIIFETVKQRLEDMVPPMMTSVLQAMFGELTVLGFIALIAYFVVRLGVLGSISVVVFGDEHHLIELFEDIHFLLFFVMILFLLESVLLVFAAIRVESNWMATELLISSYRKAEEQRASFAPLVAQLLVTYKAGSANWWRRACAARLVWAYREAEARDELRYALIRDRFIHPTAGPKPQAPLPDDFEFHGYLRREMTHTVAHALHVSQETWVAVVFFITLVIELPVALEAWVGMQTSVLHVVAMGWLLWIAAYALQAKLDTIVDKLIPYHPLLKAAPSAIDMEAPTHELLQRSDVPAFEAFHPTAHCSKHEQLFWFGRKGPQFLLFLMRTLMLLTAVSSAVIGKWLVANPEDIFLLLLGLFPVLDVIITAPQFYLPASVLATSIEQLKKPHAIHETLQEMKMERALKMLKVLNALSSQARRAQKLHSNELKRQRGAPKPRELDAAQEAELFEAFQLFDKDASGFIDRDELGELMKALGLELSAAELNDMYTEMDPSGDGRIDFKEFAQALARDPEEQQTNLEMANAIFTLLDKSGDGKVSIAELKSALISMNPSLQDDDVRTAMQLFDKNGTGDMSKQEFVHGIEAMRTFASS